MDNTFNLYIAFVQFTDKHAGKTRPILIVRRSGNDFNYFPITSQYERKSLRIKQKYYRIIDWKQAGLNKQSYVDTNNLFSVPAYLIESKSPIGNLSDNDRESLLLFLQQKE
ncbi:hypothetical protein M8332_06600 [Fructilactobacillus ixorae]|uniref:Toxin MazF n=1 Tax=Fructilactobacillus ixorae TaxID=1750535 RepID=A0ABY5C7H0_9LACO|nr:hypothetical protein [Fructilactobacillus ixorae]USS93256.1 hypothetical protein M8332_06600 [Fructilactobacillus ixorae]